MTISVILRSPYQPSSTLYIIRDPKSMTRKLKGIYGNFLREGVGDKKKIHLVELILKRGGKTLKDGGL